MLTTKKRKRLPRFLSSVILPALAAAAIIGAAVIFTSLADARTEREAFSAAERSIMRAVTSCYAFEGFYPGQLQYLKDNYGLRLSDDIFVHYEIYDPQMLPVVKVMRKNESDAENDIQPNTEV